MEELVDEAQKLNNSRGKIVSQETKKKESKAKVQTKEENIEALRKSVEANKLVKASVVNLIKTAPKTVEPVREKLDNLLNKLMK